MNTVGIVQAEASLDHRVRAIEQGREREIVIARDGRPAAKRVPAGPIATERRIGVAAGRFGVPDDVDADNEEIARRFGFGKQPWTANTPQPSRPCRRTITILSTESSSRRRSSRGCGR